MKKFLILIVLLIFASTAFTQELQWGEIQKILDDDPSGFDDFGYSVAIDGNYAVIGSYNNDDAGVNSGIAYFYEKNDEGFWEQVAEVYPKDVEDQMKFGGNVSISGTISAISLRIISGELGAVYFFERENSGTWVEKAKVIGSEAEQGEYFGQSLAISGTISAIGSYQESSNIEDAGAVYFYERENSGTWVEKAMVSASDSEVDDYFGISVDIDGYHAIIGASNEDEGGDNAGAAYYFERENSGTWVEIQKLVADDAGKSTNFGRSVSISNTISLIGAPGTFGEEAYFFELQNTNTWTQVQKVTAFDTQGAGNSSFGQSVDISEPYSVIGSHDAFSSAGRAYFFERNDQGIWEDKTKVVSSDNAEDDWFGWSVGLSGSFSIIGAFAKEINGEDRSGQVYIFSLLEESAPEITNLSSTSFSENSASLFAELSTGNLTTTFTFDYGKNSGIYTDSYSSTFESSFFPVDVDYSATMLDAATRYFVRASATNSVSWSESEEISFWTLDTEPNQVVSIIQTNENEGISEISLSWTDIKADRYLLLQRDEHYDIEDSDLPIDATYYKVGLDIGNLTVIANTTDNTFNLENLDKNQSYLFAVVPFNQSSNTITSNYNIVEVPTTRGFTIPTLGEWGMIVFGSLMLLVGSWYVRRTV